VYIDFYTSLSGHPKTKKGLKDILPSLELKLSSKQVDYSMQISCFPETHVKYRVVSLRDTFCHLVNGFFVISRNLTNFDIQKISTFLRANNFDQKHVFSVF
jgi:hypothetical protein